MARYVAFLRAINVGGHVVKMDRLRGLFESLGLRNVQTLIASGNVSFDTAARNREALESRIERHLEDALGYPVATFLRAPAELTDVCGFQPSAVSPAEFAARGLYVGFLKAPPSPAARDKLLALGNDVNAFYFSGRELYWSCATKMSESNFSGGQIEKTLKMPTTMRNITTVRRLVAAP